MSIERRKRHSKVTTRKHGEVDGTISQSYIRFDSLTQFADHYTAHMPASDEVAVIDRITYLESKALEAFQGCGFDDWYEQILLVDGRRFTGDVPHELWDADNQTTCAILEELGIAGKAIKMGMASSLQVPPSTGQLAYNVFRACLEVKGATESNDLWLSVRSMSKCEESYRLLTISLMDDDYTRGKRQREHNGEYSTDWKVVLADWDARRQEFGSDRACDRAIAELYGIKTETIKSQRNFRRIAGK